MGRRDLRADHRLACRSFGEVVLAVDGAWDRPSPCAEWDARGVLEHVIGFHEVLLLRPLGVRANRPKDDVPGRWTATQAAIFEAIDRDAGDVVDVDHLLPALTTEMVVHTWDLAKAVGLDPALEPELCDLTLARTEKAAGALRDSGLYDPPVRMAGDAGVLDRLLALVGRDPRWSPPSGD